MITIDPAKKAEIDARPPTNAPRDLMAEIDTLKAALVKKNVVSDAELKEAQEPPGASAGTFDTYK